MGSLAEDTEVTGTDGRYHAVLSPDWEIWGPMGGYIASVAFRAIGDHSAFERPATFYCQFLGTAAFGEVDIEVTTVRRGRTAEAISASISQNGRMVLSALGWTVVEPVEGLEHDQASFPEVPPPAGLASLGDLQPEGWPWFPFWRNVEARPTRWSDEWPPPEQWAPEFLEWFCFKPTETFDDPWVDACRTIVLCDVVSWPAAHAFHAVNEPLDHFAPTMDLHVVFHRQRAGEAWLLADGRAPLGEGGTIGFDSRVWTAAGELLASGGGQMLCRPRPQTAEV